jgi:hypothetical protein
MIKKVDNCVLAVLCSNYDVYSVTWTNVWFGKIRRDKKQIFYEFDKAANFCRNKKGEKIK